MYDRFPPADAERERRLAIPIRNKQDDFLCRAQDQGNHDQGQRKATGIGRKAFETQHDQTINYHAPCDRWDSIEDVSQKSQD